MKTDQAMLQASNADNGRHKKGRCGVFCKTSATVVLYAILKDNYHVDARLVTGNLYFKDQYIFKQDFSIAGTQKDRLQEWGGHAWVEVENLILDLSIFRTIYSEQFTKPFKSELMSQFGQGRGCIIGTSVQMKEFGLIYQSMDALKDGIATEIIKGFEKLLA
jgi:hypothetical protein